MSHRALTIARLTDLNKGITMRIRTILAAAAAPAALAAVLLGTAGAASASTGPNPHSVIEVPSQAVADQLMASGIDKNIDVPAGADVQLRWVDIHGNVTVEGHLAMASDIVEGNVTANGGSVSFFNQSSHVLGNLSVLNSAGNPNPDSDQGSAFGNYTQYPGLGTSDATTQVDGNVTFTGDSGWVFIGYPMHANGNLNASGNSFPNPAWFNISGLTVGGHENIS